MRGLSLCIDIDGTITEPYYWLQRVNQHFGTNVRPEDVNCYEIHQVLGIEAAVYQEFYDVFGSLLHAEAEIRHGAREVLNELFKSHSLHFVTARDGKMTEVSLEWLQRHGIPMDSISLLGSPNKVQRASELASDFFIEDSLDNAIQLAAAGFDVLLMDCNYNQTALPPNVTRVHDWFEIGKIIDQRAQLAQVRAAN